MEIINKRYMKRKVNPALKERMVDRSTIWGNPFKIKGSTIAERRSVITLYEKYILAKYSSEYIYSKLNGWNLVCWCAPLPCHADVLRKICERKK